MDKKLGPQRVRLNAEPKLERGTWPWASLTSEGEVVLNEITQEQFFSYLYEARDGWNTSIADYEKGSFIYLFLGLAGGAGFSRSWRSPNAPRKFWKVGCFHQMEEKSHASDRGLHKHVCKLCGYTEEVDSSD